MDCLFCAIAAGEIPSTKVYEDENCLAFRDIHPQAPVHVLLIPKTHIASVDALTEETAAVAAGLLCKIPVIAASEQLGDGYRVITNVGENGCQSVKHLHFHIMGGKKLPETMG